MAEHERRLHQRVLDQLFEQLGDQAAPSKPRLGIDVVLLDQSLEHRHLGLQQVFVNHLADRLDHLDAFEGPAESDFLSLVLDGGRTLRPLDEVNDERFGQL